MPEYTSPRKKVAAGLPLWVMTFADLMTLLMCFFVLILSFSELDILKYKQLAGSMAHAFGVQREVEAKEPPKGINIIAREFSPGQPQPTLMNVVRQKTIADMRIHLEVGGHKTRPTPAPRIRDHDPKAEATMKPEKPAEQKADQEIEQKAAQHADDQAGQRAQELPGQQLTQVEVLKRQEEPREQEEQREARLDDATAEEILAAREARERLRKLEEHAKTILSELEEQILSGAVDVERDGQKIIIRIREKASFASGSADVVARFKPVLWRLGEIIEGMEGRIIVAGHTDNIPIKTPRFRSNWELSASRAVSVVHELLWQTAIPLERFLVQGHGETQPVAANDTPANRAENRRVEIVLMQGDDREAEREISQRGVQSRPRAEDGSGPEAVPAPVPVPTEEAIEAEPPPEAAVEPPAQTSAAPVEPDVAEIPESATTGNEEQDAAVPTVDEPPAPSLSDPPAAAGDDAVRRLEPVRSTGSGVTAGAVRAPQPPVTTGEEQEAP